MRIICLACLAVAACTDLPERDVRRMEGSPPRHSGHGATGHAAFDLDERRVEQHELLLRHALATAGELSVASAQKLPQPGKNMQNLSMRLPHLSAFSSFFAN